MRKTLFWIFLALISGAILGKITFDFYDNVDIQNVVSYDNYVYLLMYGKYDTFDEMKENVTDIDRYIYIEKDNTFTAYIAMSKTKDNINKIKKIYDDKNIKTSVAQEQINNEEFIQNINEYEKLLSATEEEKSLLIIENQILSCYESVVMVNE